LAVWLALACALIAYAFGLPWASPLAAQAPGRFTAEVLLARRTFYLVDVMLLYAFLLLLAPLALLLLRRRLWWLLLLDAWLLWAAYQVLPQWLRLPWPIADIPVFNLAAWQVLFFTGLVLGYERDRLAGHPAWRRLRAPLPGGWLGPLALLLAGLIWLQVDNGAILNRYAPGGGGAALLDAWFDKSALPPARLLACAAVFGFGWALVTRCWRPLRAGFGWFFLPLGQAALYAYAAHLFLAALVHVGVVRASSLAGALTFPGWLHPGVTALVQLAALLLLWALTRARFLLSVTAPLGAPPLSRYAPLPGGRGWWLPSESLAVLVLVALGTTLVAPGLSAPPPPLAGVAVSATPEAAAPKPYSTVTAPRKVGGQALGSTD